MDEEIEGPPVRRVGLFQWELTEIGHQLVEYVEQEFKKGKNIEQIAEEIGTPNGAMGIRVLVAMKTLTEEKYGTD